MKNTFFKPVASFAFTPRPDVEVVVVLVVVVVVGLYKGKVLHLPQTTTTQGWYNKATLGSLWTLRLKEGKKNNTYYPSILNKNTLKNKNINKFKVRLYYSNQLNIRDSLNLPNRLGLIQNQRKYYHISNIRAFKRIGPHNEEVLSVIIGSLLGDGCCAQPLYIKNYFTTLNLPLNPNWITGFTDAEGSFIISITRSENRAIRWRVTPIFSIELHGKDLHLLSKIQSFFGVGNNTTINKNGPVVYSVKSIVDINSIIIPPHYFDNYTLLTPLAYVRLAWLGIDQPTARAGAGGGAWEKQAEFLLLKKIVELVIQKHHLREECLIKILEFKASLNKGLSPDLEKVFPDVIPVARPIVQLPVNLDTNWFLGFIDGEWSFFINIAKGTTKIGYLVQMNFNLTQHIRDAGLLKLKQEWLGCGLIFEIHTDSRVNLIITKLQDLISIFIPKFNQYPPLHCLHWCTLEHPFASLAFVYKKAREARVGWSRHNHATRHKFISQLQQLQRKRGQMLQGIKILNFEDFKLVVNLMEKKEHLNLDGLNKIRQIKSGIIMRSMRIMNTGRIMNKEDKEDKEQAKTKPAATSIFSWAQPYSLNKVQKRSFHTNVRAINRKGPHNRDIIEVIIGSILGKAHANNRTGEGVRICYRQSIRHKEYLFWLHNFFYARGYTSNLQPRQYTMTLRTKEGTEYYGYEFNTFTFRSFNWIHRMFYNNGRKVIPENIYEYLTPLALAVWIMDDGGFANYGLRIATNSFKLTEVELLQDVIKSKYNLETTIQNIYIKDQYSIYIKKKSVNNLRNIVRPYIHFSMLLG